MDNIHTEKNRDAEPALLDGNSLYLAYICRSFEVKEPAYFSLPNILTDMCLSRFSGDDIARYGQVELSQFLLPRHACHEFVHKAVHFRVTAVGARRTGCKDYRKSKD